jgi:putative membrane protein
MLIERLFWYITAAVLAVFLAVRFVPGVELKVIPGESSFLGVNLTEQWHLLLAVGIVLGVINSFLKPILNLITVPLKILTLGIFSLILNMLVVWFLDIFFKELQIIGIIPLFFTTLIVWLVNFLLGLKW